MNILNYILLFPRSLVFNCFVHSQSTRISKVSHSNVLTISSKQWKQNKQDLRQNYKETIKLVNVPYFFSLNVVNFIVLNIDTQVFNQIHIWILAAIVLSHIDITTKTFIKIPLFNARDHGRLEGTKQRKFTGNRFKSRINSRKVE